MSTFRRRRGGAPEHRLDSSMLARRIGTLGTGLTVLTCLALCAVVENALSPRLFGDGPAASPAPVTPAGELNRAVGSAVTKQLAAAARTAYGQSAPAPVVRVIGRDRRRTWAFGASALPAPVGSAAIPEAALFLAHRTGQKWSIGLAGSSRFRKLLAKVPAAVLPADQRSALTRFAAGPTSAGPGQNASTGLTLPWLPGSTWTFAGVSAGTLGFVRHDGLVRAAGAGRLYHLCAHGLVLIIHSDGPASEYAQVDPKIDDGTFVTQGAELGRVETTAPCRTSHAPARLRFALRDAGGRLPVNGLRLGAWTLHTRRGHAWATCGSQRVDAGDPITNELQTPAPSPEMATAGPTPKTAPPAAGRPSPEVLR